VIYQTEQEKFWAGKFGREYIERNNLLPKVFAALVRQWGQILSRMDAAPKSILEIGSNIGNNLHALHSLLPEAKLTGIEINPVAAEIVRKWGKAEVIEQSILEFIPSRTWDLVFTSGVLIHINPDKLKAVYTVMYKALSKYLCIAEYYSPNPEEVDYRGYSHKMYRRDFAGEILDTFPDLALRGYGFTYHRDPLFQLDDVTWFLMEKK
jgi:spore coat polysaccharide biosynthesis protein SpsF